MSLASIWFGIKISPNSYIISEFSEEWKFLLLCATSLGWYNVNIVWLNVDSWSDILDIFDASAEYNDAVVVMKKQ